MKSETLPVFPTTPRPIPGTVVVAWYTVKVFSLKLRVFFVGAECCQGSV